MRARGSSRVEGHEQAVGRCENVQGNPIEMIVFLDAGAAGTAEDLAEGFRGAPQLTEVEPPSEVSIYGASGVLVDMSALPNPDFEGDPQADIPPGVQYLPAIQRYFTPGFLPAGFLNRSGAYFPYIAGLLAITVFLRATERPGWRVFLFGVLVFCGSLALRTIDPQVCDTFPLGTHFLWHLLNAAVLFLLSRELLRETTSALPVDLPAAPRVE